MIAAMLLAIVQQQNVLVLVGDDLGWSERTLMPSLDEIAARGVTFTRFYSHPVCSPTRFAALAGLLPRRAGIGDITSAHNSTNAPSPAPDRRFVLLPEVLAPTHETLLVGKWHLGRASVGGRVDLLNVTEGGPFVSGFESWLAGNPNSIALGPGATGYRDWYRVDDEVAGPDAHEWATHAQRDAFVARWTSTSGPKFAWLAFNAAHQPYDAPPGLAPTGTARGDYEQLIADLDASLAACLAVVDWSTTIVVYLGDNGTPDDARPLGTPSGYWKGTTYEGGVRVPLIVAAPGGAAGISSARLVQATDIPATVLELAGLEVGRGFTDSVSFADELGAWAGTPARTWVFTERYQSPAVGLSTFADDQAVIETSWKLRRVDPDGPGGPQPSQDWAYSLLADPYEQAPIDPALLPPSLRARLAAELAAVPSRLP